MWGDQYAGLNIRRASAKRCADEDAAPRAAKIPAVDTDGSAPMSTDTVSMSKVTTTVVAPRGVERMGATDEHTYEDMTKYARRVGLIKKTRLVSGAMYYKPTPSPKEVYGIGLMHVNEPLWNEVTSGDGGYGGYETAIRRVAETHVRCSKLSYE